MEQENEQPNRTIYNQDQKLLRNFLSYQKILIEKNFFLEQHPQLLGPVH